MKNENSVMPILIEKNFEQKIYFCLLKMRSIFLKKGNPIFSIKLHVIKIQDFSFHTFWKKTIGLRHTLAQGCRLFPMLQMATKNEPH